MARYEAFRARATTSIYSKLKKECNISVQLHYLEVFDGSSRNRQEDLGDQVENFTDFEQRLDWTYGDGRAWGKETNCRKVDSSWLKIPLDNSMTDD